jgi:hypothetical protein
LPIQLSILHVPSPAVTPTNLLFNVAAVPGGLLRFWHERRLLNHLTWLLVAGTLPGVIVGAIIRVTLLSGGRAFEIVAAGVLRRGRRQLPRRPPPTPPARTIAPPAARGDRVRDRRRPRLRRPRLGPGGWCGRRDASPCLARTPHARSGHHRRGLRRAPATRTGPPPSRTVEDPASPRSFGAWKLVHEMQPSTPAADVRGPAKGVLTGHLSLAGAAVW